MLDTPTLRFTKTPPLLLLALTLLVTALNALKPIYIDDAWLTYPARQLLHHPFDPYGYVGFWYQWPEPANWLYTPPVWPYWLAGVMAAVGNHVLLWKLASLPWIATFVFSMHALLRRFTAERALPLTLFAVLSPVVLPGINLMMDLPTTALALAGLCVALSAIDRRSLPRALIAGGILLLAIQTKYTAALIPAAILLDGWQRRRFMLALLPGVVAAVGFAAWEIFIWRRYGTSHFLFHLGWHDLLKGSVPKSALVLPLVSLAGGAAPALGLLAMQALGAPLVAVVLAVIVIAASYVAVLIAPVAAVAFTVTGAGVCILLALASRRLWQRGGQQDRFLVGWLLLQIAGYFAVSPFPATRRLLDLFLVATILVGRSAAGRFHFRMALVTGLTLAAGFEALDINEAWAQFRAVQSASQWVDAHRQPGQTVWFVGHWAMQFYGERHGYRIAVPDHSPFRSGDWLLSADGGFSKQHLVPPPADALAHRVVINDPIPLSTLVYYSGGVPLQHRAGPRELIRIYQIPADTVPVTAYDAFTIVDWAATRGRPLPVDSVTAVLRALPQIAPQQPALAAAALAAVRSSGVAALLAALDDPQPPARVWAARSLAAFGRNPAVVAALQRHARTDPIPAVRVAAARSLAEPAPAP